MAVIIEMIYSHFIWKYTVEVTHLTRWRSPYGNWDLWVMKLTLFLERDFVFGFCKHKSEHTLTCIKILAHIVICESCTMVAAQWWHLDPCLLDDTSQHIMVRGWLIYHFGQLISAERTFYRLSLSGKLDFDSGWWLLCQSCMGRTSQTRVEERRVALNGAKKELHQWIQLQKKQVSSGV